ncbi:helitron helicase-like domain-containing protein [Artemisia annua]|uniref:Helitron helicase-like domain-containing protein n=1 Tax=Artemisia annua TaxID=35608 RepID=A0A2U1PEP4_ARTAN|nr:helitron helicase-like domain-containing protein [Artemisia annua]
MPRNAKSLIIDDIQSFGEYMYNLNGQHTLDLQPPPELNAIDQQKWVQKKAQYRQPTNSIHPGPQVFGFMADTTCPLNTLQLSTRNLQRVENLKQHSVSNMNEEAAQVIEDPQKRKIPPPDIHAFQNNKKKGLPCSHDNSTADNSCHYVSPTSVNESSSHIQQYGHNSNTFHESPISFVPMSSYHRKDSVPGHDNTQSDHIRQPTSRCKRKQPCEKPPTNERERQTKSQHTSGNLSTPSPLTNIDGVSQLYIDLGDADYALHDLIQILDEHNELVQVFRTARDKLNEENVPEFKIQLYNVADAQQYQLPSSGTLGAIVFQTDANSQTDYDIVIKYKDRQPKRINKLHSSYMSLQFPLLFVYGQPGYTTKMTLKGVGSSKKRKKLSMNMYYKYQVHERFD